MLPLTTNCLASAVSVGDGETFKIYAEKKENQHVIGYKIIEQRYRSYRGYYTASTTVSTTDTSYEYTVTETIGGAGTITVEPLYKSGCLNDHANTELKGKVEATCGRGGYTGDTVCKDCGYVVQKGEDTLPGPHGELVTVDDYVYKRDSHGNFVENKRTGEYIIAARPYEAPVCNSSYSRYTQQMNYYTYDGYSGDKICTTCGQVVERGRVIPGEKAHTFETYVTLCTIERPSWRICTHCRLMIYDIPQRTHKNKITKDAVEPSCTAYGRSGDQYCADCGELLGHGARLDPLGHK